MVDVAVLELGACPKERLTVKSPPVIRKQNAFFIIGTIVFFFLWNASMVSNFDF